MEDKASKDKRIDIEGVSCRAQKGRDQGIRIRKLKLLNAMGMRAWLSWRKSSI